SPDEIDTLAFPDTLVVLSVKLLVAESVLAYTKTEFAIIVNTKTNMAKCLFFFIIKNFLPKNCY
ncbi:MAG: hypothetical protein IIY81_10180, partial [Lachnospiraceae bacterium]|nr:hypothetical protein [Lachnospiraceae bacterium]